MKPRQLTHNPKVGSMQLDEDSIALFDTIRRRFPPFMPKKAKLIVIEKMAMHGAGIARRRGDTVISVDDILIGVHQFAWPEQLDSIRRALDINPEKLEEYRQTCLALDYVPLDDLLRDFKVSAKMCGVEIQEEKLLPALNCYKDIFEYDAVYIKTTSRDLTPREFFVRPGCPAKWFDLAAMAKDHGVADFSDNPLYQTYLSISNEVGAVGSMADISAAGEIKKFYAFFPHKPQPFARIKRCPNLPESIFINAPLLASWGFRGFTIFGVDFQRNSLNFYYHMGGSRLDRATLESIFRGLDFQMPSKAMLKELEHTAVVYFTFTYASDRVERVCFTRIYEDDMRKPVEFVPALREFIEESPLNVERRSLLLGFAFDKNGSYQKPELDYKGVLCIPKYMEHNGLYRSLDKF